MIRRTTLGALALAAAMLMKLGSADAAAYWPWCSLYDESYTRACAFSSWQQCMETVRGIGGYCYANPYRPPAPFARSVKPHRRAVRH